MLQAAVCDGGELDAFAFYEDHLGSAEVYVGRREIVDTLLIANVVIMLDKGADLSFGVAE